MCYIKYGVNMKLIIDNKKYNIEIYNNPFKKMLGFMFKKNINKIICLKRCNSIHTFFMKCNISVIMLDKNFNIVYIEKNMKKNKVLIKKDAYYTIELNTNLLKNYKKIKVI